jgi:hypothetical protein
MENSKNWENRVIITDRMGLEPNYVWTIPQPNHMQFLKLISGALVSDIWFNSKCIHRLFIRPQEQTIVKIVSDLGKVWQI